MQKRVYRKRNYVRLRHTEIAIASPNDSKVNWGNCSIWTMNKLTNLKFEKILP